MAKYPNKTVIVVLITVLFSIFYFLAPVPATAQGEPAIRDPQEVLEEILEPVTGSTSEAKNFIQNIIDRLLEINFQSVWENVKIFFESFAEWFEKITGLTIIEALKAVGGFFVTVLELFIGFIKWLLSLIS